MGLPRHFVEEAAKSIYFGLESVRSAATTCVRCGSVISKEKNERLRREDQRLFNSTFFSGLEASPIQRIKNLNESGEGLSDKDIESAISVLTQLGKAETNLSVAAGGFEFKVEDFPIPYSAAEVHDRAAEVQRLRDRIFKLRYALATCGDKATNLLLYGCGRTTVEEADLRSIEEVYEMAIAADDAEEGE